MSDEQLALVPGKATKAKKAKSAVPIAEHLPVAQVVIDTPLPHLDHVFDYAVPAKLDADAQPGVRVRVRFAGKLTDAYIVSRTQTTDHPGTLSPIASVTSPEVVLMPEILELSQTVAQRWAGTLWDVLRSAIPHRHARAEENYVAADGEVPVGSTQLWDGYVGGPALIKHTLAGEHPRAIVTTGNDDVAAMIGQFAQACAHKKKPMLILAPDRAAIERLVSTLAAQGVPQDCVALLMADDGPEKRYRQWLAAHRGGAQIVIGTRASVFAHVPNLSCIVVWDDWNDTYDDPQAPYWNARDVAVLRSQSRPTALVIIGSSVSTDAVSLMPWLAHVSRPREDVKKSVAQTRSALDDVYRDTAGRQVRIPPMAFHATSKGIEKGPVVFLVPRAGYVPRLACDKCRDVAQCSQCSGALQSSNRTSAPVCVLCGHIETAWSCARCKSTQLRATQIGAQRTAEELGRAFPGTPVRSSSGEHIVRTIASTPSIVVATPGAVPTVAGGYTAAIILDGNAQISRTDLRASEDAFHKWMEVVSQVRTGGEVVIVADSENPVVQAVIRHDPIGFATRETQLRAEVQLPPAVRLIALTGQPQDVDDFLAALEFDGLVRGPVPSGENVRYLLTCSRQESPEVIARVKAVTAARSAKKKGGVVNVRVDPRDI